MIDKTRGYTQRFIFFFSKFKSWWRKTISKFRYFRYAIWLRIKRISFKTREEKIREAEEIIRENPDIYFTTQLIRTGFTDQLIGFSFLYKMGKGLGLKYYHTRLSSQRTSIPFLNDPLSDEKLQDNPSNSKSTSKKKLYDDIFDFLGLNSYLKKQSDDLSSARIKKYRISLESTLGRIENIDDYQSLLEEMKAILHPFLKKKRKVLLTFKAGPRTYFKYYKYTAPQKDHEIDYQYTFNKTQREKQPSKFDKDAIKIMAHIRQGDTGTVKTPWGTFIPTWYITEGKFTQFENEEDIPNDKMISVDDFYIFVKDLLGAMGSSTISTLIYSDGFKKTFRWIYRYLKRKDISQEQIKMLMELEKTYDDRQFKKFDNLRGVKTFIGEEVENLYDLIYSFMEADILLFGTQGSMIPKFAATYGDKSNLPLMILLNKSVGPHLSFIGFDNAADHLLYVNIRDYDIDEISKKIESYLKKRSPVN